MDQGFLPLLALGYALLFWVVCYRYPAVALLMIFAPAPFQNDLSGGAGVRFSFSEINLLLSLPIFLLQHKRLSIGPIAWPVAAYFTVCFFSSLITWRGKEAIVSLVQMFLFMVIIVMVFASMIEKPKEIRLALFGLIPVALFFSLAIIITRHPFVFGIHKNGIGGSLGCAFLICLELWFNARINWRKWLLIACMMVIGGGLFFTLSRGAWLGAISGTIVICAMRRQWALMGQAALVLAPLFVICWMALPQGMKDYAFGFSKEHRNIEARYQSVDIAKKYYDENPILGSGVGLRKKYDATNLIWTTLAETGVLGVLALAAIHIVFFHMTWQTQAKIEQDDPIYSLVAIGAALIMSRLMHGMVDHYWARGPTMMGWAAAGMAVGAYFALQNRRVAKDSMRFKALVALSALEAHRRAQLQAPTRETARETA